MALTRNNLIGFETGGLEEANAISGSPDATEATVVRSGIRALKLPGSGDNYTLLWEDGGTSVADTNLIFGLAVNFDTVSPGAAVEFLRTLNDGGGSIAIDLDLTTGNKISVNTLSGSGAIVSDLTISADTWYFIELYFQNIDSGNVELFINGTSEGTASAQDMFSTGAINRVQLRGSATMAIFFDDVYTMSGAASSSDILGDFAVKGYQKTDGGSADQGDTLANGTWALVSETPLNEGASNDAKYQDTGNLTGSMITNSGTRSGPTGDADVGTIKVAKYIGRFKRAGGAGRTFEFLIGNSGDGVTGQAITLITGYETKILLSEAASIVPLSTESFQLGMSKSATAGQDIFCGDMWAMLGYVPSASAPSGAGALIFGPIAIAGTGVGGIEGTGALALRPPAVNGSGIEEFIGSGALALGVPAVVGIGAEVFTAAGALTIAAPAIVGTGAEAFTATALLSLFGLAIGGVGLMHPSGIGAMALGPPLIAGTAVEEFIASGALAFAVPSIAGTGTHTEGASGSGLLIIPGLVTAGTGVEKFTASGGLLLPVPSIAGSAIEQFIASGGLTIARPSISATALEKFIATGVLTIAKPSINGSGIEEFIGQGALTIAVIVITGTGVSVLVAVGPPSGTMALLGVGR